MKSKFNCNARISAVTVSVRPAQPRVGTTHTYELNARSCMTFWKTASGSRNARYLPATCISALPERYLFPHALRGVLTPFPLCPIS